MDFPLGALSFTDILGRPHDRHDFQLIIEYRLGLQIDRKFASVLKHDPVINITRLPFRKDRL